MKKALPLFLSVLMKDAWAQSYTEGGVAFVTFIITKEVRLLWIYLS